MSKERRNKRLGTGRREAEENSNARKRRGSKGDVELHEGLQIYHPSGGRQVGQ